MTSTPWQLSSLFFAAIPVISTIVQYYFYGYREVATTLFYGAVIVLIMHFYNKSSRKIMYSGTISVILSIAAVTHMQSFSYSEPKYVTSQEYLHSNDGDINLLAIAKKDIDKTQQVRAGVSNFVKQVLSESEPSDIFAYGISPEYKKHTTI